MPPVKAITKTILKAVPEKSAKTAPACASVVGKSGMSPFSDRQVFARTDLSYARRSSDA